MIPSPILVDMIKQPTPWNSLCLGHEIETDVFQDLVINLGITIFGLFFHVIDVGIVLTLVPVVDGMWLPPLPLG